jgi:integrase/recombinase XerD
MYSRSRYARRVLHLYRRHLSTCGKRKRAASCSCPVWVQGRLHGQLMRKSLGIRNWESAQRIVREWEAGKKAEVVSVDDAFTRYLTDCEARHLRAETLRKYRLLGRELRELFGGRNIADIELGDLAEYRERWKLSGVTARKKIERLRAFFKFCVERGWIEKNPATLLKPPKTAARPSAPFTDDEIEKIMAAVEEFPDTPRGRRKLIRAFVLLLRNSGLRLQDAVRLEMEQIRDGKLLLYTQKTGQAVWLPLPDAVLRELHGLGKRPFWSGEGTIRTCMGNWQRTLARLFKRAGVQGFAHKFRHTFSVNLLAHGVSIEDVAVLLGHSDTRITQRHYAPWVKVRQERLEEAVRKTFGGGHGRQRSD